MVEWGPADRVETPCVSAFSHDPAYEIPPDAAKGGPFSPFQAL